ncbi:MAG: ATP-grasp domain-containing protein [Lachnospiraceae bacterium]|nr:ATP-grasp domain-containing protein [Lachnospiraceae bacterium]
MSSINLPIIIYPCTYDNINKIDQDYKFEQDIAKELGFLIYLFNYDNFVLGDKLKLNFGINNDTKEYIAIYRGWMLTLEQYTRLYNELLTYNIKLINTPTEYRNTHYYPYSANILTSVAPNTIWFPKGKKIDWNLVRKTMNKVVVKDYVKSVKGFDFPEYLETDMTDDELNTYIDKFIQLRGDLYQGGIVLKEYVELDKKDNKTHEFRGFYINGKCELMYANSDNKEDIVPQFISNNIYTKSLGSNFYTVDFARVEKECNSYFVVECGDGQVSGLPSEKEARDLYNAIYKAYQRG